MGLSNAQIDELFKPRRSSKKSSTGYAWIKTPQGLDKVSLSALKSGVGQYSGKQGTIKRSRKGQTRIQPNGSRYYVNNWDEEVVSYTLVNDL